MLETILKTSSLIIGLIVIITVLLTLPMYFL